MDDLDWLGGEIDEIEGERDTNKVRINQIKAGFRQGYEESQETRMQEGFNEGFALAGHAAFPLAALTTLCTSFDEASIPLSADQQKTLLSLRERVNTIRDQEIARLGLTLSTPTEEAPSATEEEVGCGKEGCCQFQGSSQGCSSGACAPPVVQSESVDTQQEIQQIQSALLQLMQETLHQSPPLQLLDDNPFPSPCGN